MFCAMEKSVAGHIFIASYPNGSQKPQFECYVKLEKPVGMWSVSVFDRRYTDERHSLSIVPVEFAVTPEEGQSMAERDLFGILEGEGLPHQTLSWQGYIPDR
jgi:hypothetical protein